MSTSALPPWPYPRLCAHRGAGKLAPENTLTSMRVGHAHGYAMVEFDVKLAADNVAFLLHDATLERTSSGRGRADALPWRELSRLDAGGWHSRQYAGEPLASFDAIAAFCLSNGHALNIEIKPTPGDERRTGEVVAAEAARRWAGRTLPPLLSSFQAAALEGARASAPQLPRALLLDSLHSGWFEQAQQLGCVAVVANFNLSSREMVERLHGAGLWALAYTVNDESPARWLLGLGLDGLITDAVDRFSPHAGRLG
jgi:glycerophosphoryl diester phosphodiesterase